MIHLEFVFVIALPQTILETRLLAMHVARETHAPVATAVEVFLLVAVMVATAVLDVMVVVLAQHHYTDVIAQE